MTRLSWPVRAFCWLVLACLVAPSLVVIPMAFSNSVYIVFPPSSLTLHWFRDFFTDPQWQRAALRSLRVALSVMVCATSVAVIMVLSLAKARPAVRRVALPLIISPMIVPVISYAIAIYGFYAKLGLVGTDAGLIIAHTILAIPFPYLTISASYSQYDQTLSRVAASSGASPLQTFFLITLPMIRPGILAGALFAFLTSFDEIIVAMFIGGVNSTLPKMMFDFLRYQLSPVLAAIATILIVITSVLLVVGRSTLPVMSRTVTVDQNGQ